MKKIIIAVASALMLTAVLCFASCVAAGKIDESMSSLKESTTKASDIRESESRDMGEKISEGLSDAGDAVREGISDVSEAASDIADDIRDDFGKDETTTKANGN